jgi:hypothetical protein
MTVRNNFEAIVAKKVSAESCILPKGYLAKKNVNVFAA